MANDTENIIKDENAEKLDKSAVNQSENVKEESKKDKAPKARTLNPAEENEETLKISILLTELIGTFVLTGAFIKLAQQGTVLGNLGGMLSFLGIAFVFMILVVIFGSITETYFNPAVAIALLINRKIEPVKAVAYIIAQIIGALLALLTFHALWKAGLNTALTTAINSQGGSSALSQVGGDVAKFAQSQNTTVEALAKQLGLGFVNMTLPKGVLAFAFCVETLGSAIFGLAIGHAVYAEKKPMLEKGFVAGFGLLAGLLVAGSTAILNPAVAGALGVFQWGKFGTMTFWSPIIVYILGALIGMAIGVTVYRLIREKALNINVF